MVSCMQVRQVICRTLMWFFFQFVDLKKILVTLIRSSDWRTDDLRPELPVSSLILFSLDFGSKYCKKYQSTSILNSELKRDLHQGNLIRSDNTDSSTQIVQNELLVRLLGVTEFINEINIEKLALTQPYCCRNIEGECKHEAKQVIQLTYFEIDVLDSDQPTAPFSSHQFENPA